MEALVWLELSHEWVSDRVFGCMTEAVTFKLGGFSFWAPFWAAFMERVEWVCERRESISFPTRQEGKQEGKYETDTRP